MAVLQKDKLVATLQSSPTIVEAARKLDITPQTIYAAMKKYGVKATPKIQRSLEVHVIEQN